MSKAFVIPTQFTAVDRFSSPVRRMSDSVEKFALNSRASLAFAERGFRRLMAPISAINRMMMGAGLYVGLYSFINVLRSVIRTIADFQEAQINISTVLQNNVSDNKALSEQARSIAIRYGMAAESVSNLQYELIKLGLNDKPGGIQNVIDATPAISLGSKAMNAPVDKLSQIVGSGMSLFNKTPQELVDLYAVGLDKSAMDFESFSTMLSNSQQGFSKSKRPVEELVALMAIASNAFVHAASAGTGIKNMFIDNAVEGKQFEDQMKKIIDSANPLETINEMYGRRTFQVVGPLADAFNSGNLTDFLSKFQPDQVKGYSESIAEKRMQGINSIFNKVKASWQELILSIDEGNGKISAALTRIGQTTTAMFLLASGSNVAREQLAKMDATTVQTAQSWIGLIEKVWSFIKVLVFLKALIIAYRAIVLITAIIQGAWSIALGLASAMTLSYSLALKKNTLALATFNTVTRLATISQTGLNVAQYASPLIILAVGIFAVIGGFSLMSSWLDDLTGGFGSLTGSVTSYTDALKNIPTVKDLPTMDNTFKSDMPRQFSDQRNFLGNQDAIMRSEINWNRDQREGVIEQITPKKLNTEDISELADLLKGSLDININDKSGAIQSATSTTDLIKVKTNSTFGETKK